MVADDHKTAELRMDIKWSRWVVLLAISAIALTFASSVYTHVVSEDFYYFIEATCDPEAQSCFVRDCSFEECPPNELDTYKVYKVSAALFSKCQDNECSNICPYDEQCIELSCHSQEEVMCTD